ncbi:hypothetical protein OEZ60_18390 [Defluviimonas sp. WL0024]|uniref:Uncharacterized protein n=1 Tax=Albidovulum salinarum TaxID=2984153 RepID=A0ABT2X7N8_9RHOB|nr:hypothetical protein [Defluviimonas sp. WL0024]MCU9849973.1 hypothetical protein [Defluviimonas sp. WL0024]
MIRFALTLLLLALAQPSLAQEPVEQVRALLDAGDIQGLEQTLGALHDEQRKGGSARTLRDVHARLFETTHPERGAVIMRWKESYPESVYAATAAAWRAIKILEATGNLERRYHEPVSPFGLAAWSAAREDASRLIGEALALSDDYTPAQDAWFRLGEAFPDPGRFGEMLDLMMASAPEADSIRIIIAATQGWSPDRERTAVGLCFSLVRLIADYGVDRCVVEAAMRHSLVGDVYAAAAEALKQIDDPELDWARAKHAVFAENPTTWQPDQLIAWHHSALPATTDLQTYVIIADQIASLTMRSDLRAKTSDLVLAHIAALAPDNPFDPSLRRIEAQLHLEAYQNSGDAADLALARTAWEAAMVHGENDGALWQLGSKLAIADRPAWGVAAAIVFHDNAIAHSGQSIAQLVITFKQLDRAWRAANEADSAEEGVAEALVSLPCPMLHSVRLLDALCKRASSVGSLCDPTNPPVEHGAEVLAAGSSACPEVAGARLSALQYHVTPYAKVTLPWK